jgi:outer membrane protein assembly complex protein YaeT
LKIAVAVIVTALASTGAAAQEPRSSTWLQRRLESGLSEALQGTVRIGRLDVDWTSLAATVGAVTIEIPADGAPPLTARIGEGRVQLAWEGLTGIAAGRIHISEVVARNASFTIDRAWVEAWKPRRRDDRGRVEVRIDRLVVEGGAAEYADGGLRLRVRAEDLSLHGDWSTSRRSLVAEAKGRATIEGPPFATTWTADVRGGVRLGPGRLEIASATASGPGAAAELRGNVTWGAGTSFTAEGRVDADLARLAPALRGKVPLEGHVVGPVQVVYVGGSPVRVSLQAATTGFLVGPVRTTEARAAVTLRPGRLEAASIEARAYGGTFTGSADLGFAGEATTLDLDVAGKGADLGALIALAGKPLPLAARADVTLKLNGDPEHPPGWRGTGTFDAAPRPGSAGLVPVGGRGTLAFEGGHVRVHSDAVEAGAATFALDLDAELAGSPPEVHLAVAGTTRDAAATRRDTLILLDALGVPRNRFVNEPVEGAGRFAADVRAAGAARVALSLDLENGSWSEERFATAGLDLVVDDKTATITRLSVRRDGEGIDGSLTVDLTGEAIAAVDVRARGVRLSSLLPRLGVKAEISGAVDLDLSGHAVDGQLAAQGRLFVAGLVIGREIFQTVEAPVVIESGLARLEPVTIRGHGVLARAGVVYDLEAATARIDLHEATVRLSESRTLAEAGLHAEGTLHASGPVDADRSGASGFLSVAGSDVVLDTGRTGLREILLDDFEGRVELGSTGLTLAIGANPVREWTFEGVLGWSQELPLSAVLYFDDLTVGAGGAFGESVDLRLKGQVQAEGELTAPREMELNGAFDEVAVRVGPTTLRAAEPFPLRLNAGRFLLGPSRFAAPDASLELAAAGSIEGAIEGRLAGRLDLGVVSSVWSDLRGAGAVTVEVTLAGTVERPDLQGRVVLDNGRLRLIGYPQSLEHVDAEVRLEGQTLRLGSFHAALGGGEVSASGEAALDGLTPASYHASIDAANVSVTFPEAFKGTYQGRLRIDGSPKGATIAGRIDVVRGLYAKEFDLAFTAGAQREFAEDDESRLPRNVLLDVDLVAPGNVWVRNAIAKLEIEGALHLGGSLLRPEVTGRLSLVPGGTVRYRDVDYRLEHGTLDLTDTRRINPYIDLRGRTRVEEYDITLHVEGTADKFDYELTSLPPLSSQDIISLLVTGKTLDDINASGAASEIPGDMAAYYFAGLLNETFGRTLQSSLGIDQFQLTPLLLKGVSDKVKVVFSQDIGTAQKQTYQVVMDATRRVRLIAESDSDSGLGGEVQYSQQFGGGNGKVVGRDDGPVVEVGSVQVVVTDGPARPDLIKTAKIKTGKPFDRGRMLEGADRIRAALVKAGFVQSDVRSEAVLDGALYRIVYTVTTGPKVTVEIVTPDGKKERSFRKKLRTFWRETPYTPDIWEEAAKALLDALQADGYYAADVSWHATDSFAGRVVRFDVDRGRPVRLRSLRLEGASAIPVEQLEKQMLSLQKKSLRKRLLRPDVLARDVATLRAVYRDAGYVRVRLDPPAITLAATGDAADVVIAIAEGPRFEVRDVAFEGEAPADEGTLAVWTPLAEGSTFSPRRLAMAEQALRDRLDERGYPEASVESEVELGPALADVTFDVASGEHKTVGAVVVQGHETTKNRTIRRLLTFGQGDPVSRAKLLETQQRLYRTGLFSSVRLTFAPQPGAEPSVQEVRVRLQEAPPWNLGFGLGYDSEDGPRASFLLGYSNLGGRNIGIALQGLASPNDARAQITVRHRRVFQNSIDSLGSLLWERTVQDAFTEWRNSASIRLERRPITRWIQFVRYTIEDVRIGEAPDALAALDEIFEDKLSTIRLGSLAVGVVRDTRDDAFVPTRGGYGSIETTVYAPPLGSEASFGAMFLRGSWVKSFRNGTRLATFVRVGAQQPFADTDLVPLSERYFAGGSSTMRGFEEDSVGGLVVDICSVPNPPGPDILVPCAGQGTFVGSFNSGGEALLLLNQEWHYPIWKSLQGEVFLDVGNVYPQVSDFDPLDVRASAGLGLRLVTPIGPIRAEYGWKLDREEGESPGEFIFAIGLLF